MNIVFKMPKIVNILGRTSSITNAFVNGIIPVIEPTNAEIKEALYTLGMTEETICCAYCGNPCTEWDHFNPIVKNKKPTGYISEIHNLVPSCGKCNQSKGNKNWKEWMLSKAKLSPKTRKIVDLDERVKRLEIYESKYKPVILDFEKIVDSDKWMLHWQNCDNIHKIMRESQKLSDEIKLSILSSIK